MKNRYLEMFVAFLVAGACILIGLYIVGGMKSSIIDNIVHNAILRIAVTIVVCLGFAAYIFLLFKQGTQRSHIIGFSLLFEALGSWWLDNWLGYLFVIIGTVLLILSFFKNKL